MKGIFPFLGTCLLVPIYAIAQTSSGVPEYGQCGGLGYTGPTECANPNFPQVVIECKAINSELSQCLNISDRSCPKVACKCAIGWVTVWYTGPEPTRCRLCNCVPASSSKTPTFGPVPTKTTLTPTFGPAPTKTTVTSKSSSTSTSQVIYPYYPPALTTTSSCPPATTTWTTTCSAPAGQFTQTETVLTTGIATVCAQTWCQCPIWDCFCRPPAVYVPSTYGACAACTCSTPAATLVPTSKPSGVLQKEADESVTVTAFLEAEVVARHEETPTMEIGTTWRKRLAMPKATPI